MKSQAFKGVLALVVLGAAAAAQAQTWGQVWSDEFNGSGAADANNWTYETGGGGWGNAELEFYQGGTANSSQTGGHLNIQARIQSVGGMPYTSARLKTQGHVSFGPGDSSAKKIEGSLQGPNGQGLWPAFWMLGTNITSVPWPGCGEIDIMEHINALGNTFATIHWADTTGAYANFTFSQPGVSFTSFHTYAITWDANLITGYLDGAAVGAANIAGNINGTDEFHRSFFILLNLAVGGNWPGSPNSAGVFPANYNIDYIRYYQAGAVVATPTATPNARATATVTPRPGARATATPTTSGCTGTFTQGVDNVSATQARPWFKLCSGTASYVILHYIRPGLGQQNVQMTFNSAAARWEFTVSGMAAGQVLQYQFTYDTGFQADSAWFTWIHP